MQVNASLLVYTDVTLMNMHPMWPSHIGYASLKMVLRPAIAEEWVGDMQQQAVKVLTKLLPDTAANQVNSQEWGGGIG